MVDIYEFDETGEVRVWGLGERSVVHEIEPGSILPDQPLAGVGWEDDTHIRVVTEPGTLIEFTTDADELIGLANRSLTRGSLRASALATRSTPAPPTRTCSACNGESPR